ncbi:MAG: FHA domain-containing protein [Eubacterium sp.]|nr:FHA domain-containing protein [Eubacterium sp.]
MYTLRQNDSYKQRCPRCDSWINAGDRYCCMCGKRIDMRYNPRYDDLTEQPYCEVVPTPSTYTSEPAPRGYRLTLYIPDIDEMIDILSTKDTITVGSAADCDIVANRMYVSRKHAVLHFDSVSGEWQLFDNSSTNGTYINNRRVGKNTIIPLNCGDKINLSQKFQMQIVS